MEIKSYGCELPDTISLTNLFTIQSNVVLIKHNFQKIVIELEHCP